MKRAAGNRLRDGGRVLRIGRVTAGVDADLRVSPSPATRDRDAFLTSLARLNDYPIERPGSERPACARQPGRRGGAGPQLADEQGAAKSITDFHEAGSLHRQR